MTEFICLVCGYEGRARRLKRGSRGVEIFLWATLFFPGPLYSLWRRIALPKQCPNCSMPRMVSLNSDEGMLKRRQMDAELGILAPPLRDAPGAAGSLPPAEPPAPVRRPVVDPDSW